MVKGEREEEKGSSDGETGGSVTSVPVTDTVVDHHLSHKQYQYYNLTQLLGEFNA